MKKDKETGLLYSFHKDRIHTINEVHARPALQITPPSYAFHIIFTCNRVELARLFSRVANTSKKPGTRHIIGNYDGIKIKTERHTEFSSCTLITEEQNKENLEVFKNKLFSDIKIKVFSICQILINHSDSSSHNSEQPCQPVLGGVMKAQMRVSTSLIANHQGIVTYHVSTPSSDPHELGRRIQRLLEVETYRIMALIGLPLARRLAEQLTDIEEQLKRLSFCMENLQSRDLSPNTIFKKLSVLSEQISNQRIQSRYRFAASNAYFSIVDARLTTLEETPDSHLQTISGFLRSRLEPAQSTINSVERRQQELTDDITRALTLLRTRIEININQSNQSLLQSMDRRHQQHLLIARVVESLSSIAITAYSIDLLFYLFSALEKANLLPFSAIFATAAAIPATLVIAWRLVHQVRSKISKKDTL
ncbi:MAG: DUF3422 family protein [Cellvibrionaceae bacterium]